jgi:hypothetical protein
VANERIADAKVLLTARRWATAYYLAGYAIECGLKACILLQLATAADVVFEDRSYSERCWAHNLAQFVDLAGLTAALAADAAADPALRNYGDTVKDGGESSRYARTTKADAEELHDAITDKKHGVLSWIKARW